MGAQGSGAASARGRQLCWPRTPGGTPTTLVALPCPPFSQCTLGRWKCEERPCPHRCALEGGSFVTTFDARPYRFHGTCTYTLLQVGGPPGTPGNCPERSPQGEGLTRVPPGGVPISPWPSVLPVLPRAPSSPTGAPSWLPTTSLGTPIQRPPWSPSSTCPAR